MRFHRGDIVQATIGDWTVRAFVAIASGNGNAIALLFDGAAPVRGGYMMGSLFLNRQADGTWTDLTGTLVEVVHRHRYTPDHNGECTICDEPADDPAHE